MATSKKPASKSGMRKGIGGKVFPVSGAPPKTTKTATKGAAKKSAKK